MLVIRSISGKFAAMADPAPNEPRTRKKPSYPIGPDLREVANASKKAIGNAWRPAAALGDLFSPLVIDGYIQQPSRAQDNLLELRKIVVVEAQHEPEPAPQTGAQVVAWVHAHAGQIRRDFGQTPAEYLAALAGSSRAGWKQWADEAGVPYEARPSFGSIGKAGQLALVANDVSRWTSKDFAKL